MITAKRIMRAPNRGCNLMQSHKIEGSENTHTYRQFFSEILLINMLPSKSCGSVFASESRSVTFDRYSIRFYL